MLRNRALGTALLLLACALGLLWMARIGGRAGPEVRAAAEEERPPAPGALEPDDAPRRPAGRRESQGRTVEAGAVPEVATAPEAAAAFEADAVYGKVQGPGGDPVAGARVLFFTGWLPLKIRSAPAPEAEVATTDDGRFRFPGLDVFADYRLYVEAEGFVPRFTDASPGHEEEVELAEAMTVAGTVRDAGTGSPLPGVEVRSEISHWTEEGQREYVVATSDAEGGYRLPWARPGEMQEVQARRPGQFFEPHSFQVDASREDGYDLLLSSPSQVRLELYDLDTGAVLPDLEVELTAGHVATTDATGRIDLLAVFPEGRDRRMWLQLEADGYCRTYASIGPAPGKGAPDLVRLPLTRGARVRGRVVDDAGRPVAEARVDVIDRGRYRSGGARLAGLPPGVSLRSHPDPVLTDTAGSFERTGLVPGPHPLRVLADREGYVRAQEEGIVLPVAGAEAEVELVLESGAVIEGDVTVDGTPASTRVTWSAEGQGGSTRSNDRGRFHLRGIPAGEVSLTASLDERTWSNVESAPETVWVEPGATVEHDLEIVSNRTPLAGVVRDALGAPVGGASVWAWASDEEGFRFSTSGETDAEGAFELRVEARQGILYRLGASEGSRNASLEDVLPGTTGIELVLPELGELRLAVLDAATREPVSGFSLYWRAGEGDRYRTLRQGAREYAPGPDGSFVARIPVGPVELYVSARQAGYFPVHVSGARAEPVAMERPLPVLLERGVLLVMEFEVEEALREPFRKWLNSRRAVLATEEQRAAEESGGDYFQYEVRYAQALRVDDSGRARIRGLAPGTYGFLWAPKGCELSPATFEVPYVDEHRMTIQVRAKPEEDEAAAEAEEEAG